MKSKSKSKKLPFGITEEFESEVQMADVASLKNRIAAYEAEKHTAREFLASKEEIVSAAALLKEMSGPFSDSIKAARNKQKYIVSLLKERGEFSEQS